MPHPASPAPDDRRGFLGKLLALGFGAAALAVPAFAAVAACFNPWRQKKTAAGKWIPVASLDALPVGRPPKSFPVVADRWDAWNHYPPETVGKVFLCRPSEKEVLVLQNICPHNGGFVEFREDKKCFWCATHGAMFDEQGRRLGTGNVSPRDLDTLEAEIREDNVVWVKFEKFRDGIAQKIVVS